MRLNHHPAFTLAELLIALGILAVIATFTIPKILSAQSTSSCRTVLKETVGALSEVIYQKVVLERTLVYTGTGYEGDQILDSMNAIKVCYGNSESLGCWNSSTEVLGGSSNRGFRLGTGAVVVGQALNPNTNSFAINIDCNGINPPNVVTEDQLGIQACYDTAGCLQDGRLYQPGTLRPNKFTAPGNINSTTFYESLFTQ